MGSLVLEMIQKLYDSVVTGVLRVCRSGLLQDVELIDMLFTIQSVGSHNLEGYKPP
jgi:hypothetical protein